MMYLTGLLLGGGLAWMLVSQRAAEGRDMGTPAEVVLTTCDLRPGLALEASCVEVRTVSSRRIPPGVISVAELDAYLGRPVHVRLVRGSALRAADFVLQK